MKITFTVKTNMDRNATPLINTLHVPIPGSDNLLVVDRDRTEWGYPYEGQDGILSMTWQNCYVWNGKTERYDFTSDEIELIAQADELQFELEDEAAEDEFYEILDFHLTY